MSEIVVEGAKCQCVFGQNQCPIQVLSNTDHKIKGKKVATIMDFTPGACISGFGTCKSPANPAYVASQSAGGPPPPCTPLIVSPWSPGSTKTSLKNMPALIVESRVSCALAVAPQSISINGANQTSTTTK